MITDEKRLKRYCREFQKIENYEEAVQSTERYDLHHRKGIETLDDGTVLLMSAKDLKLLNLYWNRSPEELIFLKHIDHTSRHHKGKSKSSETIAKMSAAKMGHIVSEETRAKISAAHRGKKLSPERIAKISGDKNPMYGRTGDKSPQWKGDLVSDKAKRRRLRNQRKRVAINTVYDNSAIQASNT